jgi:pimeloyl-ACP methyl ester carboxylesterase
VLVHGAATTSRVWRQVAPLLTAGGDLAVTFPDRPCSGDLAAEVAALRPACAGALVAGVSGGATLGLALAAAEAPADPGAVARDLATFTRFEPAPARPAGPVLITVGERSPAARHEAAVRLSDRFGFPVEVIPEAGHAVHLTHPAAFAAVVRRVAAGLG